MAGSTLSKFTPSLGSHELLERLFVARGRILDEIMRRVQAAASTTERHHTLLVGPRGAGKTHAVSLVYHRTRVLMDGGRPLQVAWLPEDPWTIVSYRHLLAEIVRRLEPPVEGDLPRAGEELEGILHARAAAAGPIVVIVENLDVILQSIGDEGQQRLRHLLQADRSLLVVATTTTLDRSLSDQSLPFYSFFTTTRLEPFDVEQAAEMLTAIAQERGDDALVAYLASDEGRARLRTIEHLAGGQPRMWAALASALTVEGLDELVDLLLTRFDDLTPYYQEQLGRLSGHQRLVVAELAEADRPMTVKELAERLEIDQRSLGKTVSELVERRWVAETSSSVTQMLDRRRTYYELAEPMARLSFQIKDNRGEPLRVIVDFLKHWFDPEDLMSEVLADTTEMGERVLAYLRAASEAQGDEAAIAAVRHLTGLPPTGGAASSALAEVDDALDALGGGRAEPFLRLPASVRSAVEARMATASISSVRVDVHLAALHEIDGTGFMPASARPWVDRALGLAAGATERAFWRQAVLVRWLAKAGRLTEAVQALRSGADPGGPVEALLRVNTLADVANMAALAGDIALASRLQSEAVDLLVGTAGLPLDGVEELTAKAATILDDIQAFAARMSTAIENDDWVDLVLGGLPDATSVAGATAQALDAAGRDAEARRLRLRVVEVGEATWGPDDPRVVAGRGALEAMGG